MNNSVLGKLKKFEEPCACKAGYKDAHLLRKRVAEPTFYRDNPITDCLIGEQVATLTLNRPIYVGFTVLELSKLHMYDFHYNHMKVKYPHANQLLLLFTDTDSLSYVVQTEDIYRIWLLMKLIDSISASIPLIILFLTHLTVKHLDSSDELNSVPMREFVGLRPKCYVFHCVGKVDKNVLEHTRPVEKTYLHFTHYLDTLRSFKSYVCKQNLISSSSHTVRTVHTRNVGLTALDTKQWLGEDTVHTHSHGHKDTVSDPMYLVTRSFIIRCIVDAGVFSRNDLPGTSLRPERLESDSDSDLESDPDSDPQSPY